MESKMNDFSPNALKDGLQTVKVNISGSFAPAQGGSVYSFLWQYVKNAAKRLPKNILQNWPAMAAMIILWLLPAVLMLFGKSPDSIKALNFISGGAAGLAKGGFAAAAGGAVSKALILTFFISAVNKIKLKKSPFTVDFLPAFCRSFGSALKPAALSYSLIGLGSSFVLHAFFTTDGRFVNSAASIIAAFYAMKALTQKNNFIAGLASRVIKKNPMCRSGLITGIATGFAAAAALSPLLKNVNILYISGLLVIAAGIVLAFIKPSAANAARTLALLLIFSFCLPMFSLNADAAGQPKIELILPEYITPVQAFDIKIKINDKAIKKDTVRISLALQDADAELLLLSGRQFTAEKKNYNGEDEVSYKAMIRTYVDVTKFKIEASLWTDKDFVRDGNSTFLVASVSKDVSVAKADLVLELPEGFDYNRQGFTPYLKNSTDNSANAEGMYRFEANGYNDFFKNYSFYVTTRISSPSYIDARLYANKYQPSAAAKPDDGEFKAYCADYITRTYDSSVFANSQLSPAPEDIMKKFNADEGYYVLVKVPETESSTGHFTSFVHIYCFLRDDFSVTTFGAKYGQTVKEPAGAAFQDGKAEELINIIRTAQIVPKTDNLQKSVQQITADGIPPQVNSVGTSKASHTKGAGAPVSRSSAGAVAIALAGAMFAVAASGAAGAASGKNEGEEEKDERRKEYELVISKDAGSKLKCDKPVTMYAGISVRTYEDDGTFSERMDPALSSRISFSSPDKFVEFTSDYMSGDTKAVSFAAKSDAKGKPPAEQLTVTCLFTGTNGSHRENVVFDIADEAYIEIEQKLSILAASGNTREFPFRLVDFIDEPAKIDVKAMETAAPFEIKADMAKGIVTVTDTAVKKPFEDFFESFNCEITAENKNEKARTVFSVVCCNEGILADFLGKPHEIKGYREDENKPELPETTFALRCGVWNESEGRLDIAAPDDAAVAIEDEKKVFELMGGVVEPDKERSGENSVLYVAKIENCLPAKAPVEGKLSLSGSCGERQFENKIDIKIIPDLLKYEQDFEKEYQACKRVIEVYMSERFKSKKLEELEKNKRLLGLADLNLFRKKCWEFAEQCVMQEQQQYIMDEAWYDEAIATAEFAVYVGDIAFDIALAPIGGPITGFLAGQVKAGLLEFLQMCVDSKGKSTYELAEEFVENRIIQTFGSADGLIEMPDAKKPTHLAIWLGSYVIYRIAYHWWFDKDESGTPIGIAESINKGLLDFVGKGAGVLLGDFIKKAAKGRWPEKISITDADQALVNKTKVAKAGLEALDKAAKATEKTIDDFILEVGEQLQKMQAGLI